MKEFREAGVNKQNIIKKLGVKASKSNAANWGKAEALFVEGLGRTRKHNCLKYLAENNLWFWTEAQSPGRSIFVDCPGRSEATVTKSVARAISSETTLVSMGKH